MRFIFYSLPLQEFVIPKIVAVSADKVLHLRPGVLPGNGTAAVEFVERAGGRFAGGKERTRTLHQLPGTLHIPKRRG